MRTATTRGPAAAFAAVIATVLSIVISVGSASAVTLKGEWAPFNRCPVDDPAMLATSNDVGTLSICLTVEALQGSLTIGGLALKTGPINSQMGVLGSQTEKLFTGVIPKDGGIVTAPQQLPGGLAKLLCPKSLGFLGYVCELASSHQTRLNRVTSTLESAGAPVNFDLLAALVPGGRIITLPTKLHLQNPLLGPGCYIGSDEHPILLQPATLKEPEPIIQLFDADGTPDEKGVIFDGIFLNTSQLDTTFAVGKATGCGYKGRLDNALNRRLGLPSPAGSNRMFWDGVSSYLIGLNEPTSTDGKDLAAMWHGAVIE